MSSETKSPTVIGSARIISSCILLSRILGFIRDILCAGFFGKVWDAFIFAFTIPNLFRRLFGEGALSAAFIPTFSDYLENKPSQETARLINAIVTLLFGLLSIIALVVIGGSFLLPLVSEDKEWADTFGMFLRILIPYLPLICLVALFSAILNTFKHFTMPALASVVLNICWIGGFVVAWFMGDTILEKITIIAWSILLGGVLEVLIQIPPLIKRKISYRPSVAFNHPGIKEITRLMAPIILGLAVFQINLILDYVIALVFVPEGGAISALYFGNRLMQFPLAVIGISLAQAVFPFLTDYAARKDIPGLKEELTKALKFCLFIAVPATVGLIILAQPIIRLAFAILPQTLLGIKGFSNQAVERTSWVLIFYASGIWAYAGLQIITRAFYALKDTKTPVRIGVWMVMSNLVMNIILVQFLKEGGIALATAITAVMNLLVLSYLLDNKLHGLSSEINRDLRSKGLFLPLVKSLVASCLMGVICYGLLRIIPVPQPGLDTRSIILILSISRVVLPLVIGIFSYLVFSYFLQRQALKNVWQGLRSSPR